MFFCFPDPHFKAKNHRRRIIRCVEYRAEVSVMRRAATSKTLLSEYAHFLKPNGRLYTITDVEELHRWHVDKCEAHPYFERVADEEAMEDEAAKAMLTETEEGQKVARMGGRKYFAVFRRLPAEELPLPALLTL
jgi:tRNA (guanine-N7-)-methyltransferase